MNKEDCIFCRLANGDIPSKTIYEDEGYRVILDLSPATKGHALILPKDHYENLYELPDENCGQVMRLARKMAERITHKLKCNGFNLVQNNGEAAGQTVFHFHMHLIPRYRDDHQNINWDKLSISDEELDDIKNTISGN